MTRDGHGGHYPSDLYTACRPAEMIEDLAAVDDRAIARFRADGYLAVRHGLPRPQVGEAIAGLARVVGDPGAVNIQFESWADPEADDIDARLDGVRRLMRFVGTDPRIDAVAEDPNVLATVRRLLGTDDIRMIQDMALLKPPGGGREKPWHQDKAFFNLDLEAPVVGVWIALDEATADNGCMHVARGSHRDGPMPHFNRRDWQLCDTDVRRGDDVVVPLPPGGMLIFDGYLHHGTPANRTTTRRRALQFHYAPADIADISTEQRLDVFGLEGRGAEC